MSNSSDAIRRAELRAVHPNESTVRTLRPVMDRASNQLFPVPVSPKTSTVES